ncbi:MAG: hypothetical protein IJ132_02360 [Firmicutes bacterium]|nr:hypothetical protein [Bacillota bacterium]
MTDFGGDGHAYNPIDCVMREKNLGFKEALVWIVSELNLTIDSIDGNINKPKFEKGCPALPEMKEGEWYYELATEFSAEELRTMGPLVTQEDVDKLHWHSVVWVGKCENRCITKKYSTPTYPIFMCECYYKRNGEIKSFFKKYEPKNPDKQYRFMYIGTKPQDYLNGLWELEEFYARWNEQQRNEFEKVPANENKAYK